MAQRPLVDLFILPDDRRQAQDTLPPAEAAPAARSGVDVAARLSAGANDRFRDLVVAGWQEEAVPLLLADGVARCKRITWLIRPGHARAACDRLQQDDAASLAVRLVMVPDRGTLPLALERVGLGWSLAVMDDDLVPAEELNVIGLNRFNRRRAGLERVHRDLGGMLARVETLPQTIALSGLRGLHAGCAALCLAAGPSLRQHLDRIRALAADCVVVVVDVIQKRLQEEGIPVDYVVTVDTHAEVVGRMAPASDPRTVLVMPVNAAGELDRLFAQRCCFPSGGSIGFHLAGDERFQTGTMVGAASVGFAHWLGCTDLLLFGHDLSYGKVMYSDLVDGAEKLDAFNRNIITERRVPGNGGSEVATDYLFEVAIDDFRMILADLPGSRAYNANIATGVGAVIPGTLRLPDDWRPGAPFRRGDHRPEALPRLRPPVDGAEGCRQAVRGHMQAMERRWAARTAPEEATAELLPRLPDCRLADLVVGHCLMPGILAATRQLAMPPSLSMEGTLAEVRSFIDESFHRSIALLGRLLDGGGLDQAKEWEGYACQEGAKELHALLCASLSHPTRPDVGILLSTEISHLADLLLYRLCPPPPIPRSAAEGLLIVRRLMPLLDDRFLAGVLALCRLEGQDEPLAWARERSALAPGWHPDDAETAAEAPPLVRACRTLRRLQSLGPKALGEDALQAIAALPQAQAALVRALVVPGAFADDRVAALQRLVERGALVLDDQLSSLILLHLEGPAAFRLLRRTDGGFSEASILAMAQRLGASDPGKVLRYARDYRPLSRFHDQMQVVVVQTLLGCGRHQEALAACADLWDGDLGHRLRCEALVAAGQLLEARAHLLLLPTEEGAEGLAARLLKAALDVRDPELLGHCARAVQALAIRLPALAGLARSAGVLLARLPAAPAGAPRALPPPDPASTVGRRGEALEALRLFLGQRWNDGVPLPRDQRLVSTGLLDATARLAVAAEAARQLRVTPPLHPPAFDTAEELVAALSGG